MPYEIRLPGDSPPLGYTLDAAPGEGHQVRVTTREFTSSGDGELFVSRLEGVPLDLLSLLPKEARVEPSKVDHLVGIVRKNMTATVYVNECAIKAQMRSARAIEAGEYIGEDDLVDIARITFGDVVLPPDAGLVLVFSYGWRKGLYFDLDPLRDDGEDRHYDVEARLGSYMAYLMNAEIASMDQETWDFMISRGWFPFIGLPRRVSRSLVGFARSGIDLDVVLPEVVEAVKAAVTDFRQAWAEAELFRPHLDLLTHALDRFAEGDYVSCTAIVYPRIEGILRSIHEQLGESERAKQMVLARIATEGRRAALHENSWLLPDGFRRFLEEAYFASFEPGKPATLSRNSVGHGVADPQQFGEKGACLGLLIVHQLFFYLPESEIVDESVPEGDQ